MKAYLPAFTKDWLDTNPPEGEKLFIAAVAFFADHWGVEVYQEWESLDIKNFNHTCKDFMVQKMLRKLTEAGVIQTIKGLDEVESIRLSKVMANGSRMIFGPSAIPFELSEQSSILWAYFLGRTADMLERSYSEELMAPIEVKRKKYKVKPKPLPKVGSGRKRPPKEPVAPIQHVIPHVYRAQFINRTTTNK
jgi:hypothetical protein